VSRHVGQQQAADAARGAAGRIVNVAARVCLAERLAINPSVQPAEFDALRSELAAAPYFHALHLLRRLIGHFLFILCGVCWKARETMNEDYEK
jgi:hypothetical protein